MSVARSVLLARHGFAHGFSLRLDGLVEDTRKHLASTLDYSPGRLFEVDQVHGGDVRMIGTTDVPTAVRAQKADALVAGGDIVAALGVRVADCAPVLIGCTVTGAVAAVHVGWRGAVSRVLDHAVATLEHRLGVRPADLVAAIGPHIRSDAFEVGPEVAAQIEGQAHGASVVQRAEGKKPHVDLAAVIVAQLGSLGLERAHIDDVGGCTWSDAARFYSFRRDGERAGRHLGVIVVRT